MKKYARFFDDGRVIETHYGNPETDFVAAIAAQFQEVPDDVQPNDKRLADGTFEKYVAEKPPKLPAPVKYLSAPDLANFMSRAERLAYKAAASSDPIVEDFAAMLDLGPLVLTEADTTDAIDKLAALKVLTAARAKELKDLEA
tara:strand:- start:3688 stop:4116 length:429 start_codon:yes stop_codon:yes gene_type:complete